MPLQSHEPPVVHPWHPTSYRSLKHVEQVAKLRKATQVVRVGGQDISLSVAAPRLVRRVGDQLQVLESLWQIPTWKAYMTFDSQVWSRWLPHNWEGRHTQAERVHNWESSAMCESCGRFFHGAHTQLMYVGIERAYVLDYVVCPFCAKRDVLRTTREVGYLASWGV